MNEGRAAKIGAARGALVGALFALLFGALSGVLFHYADSGGKRDFVSAANIEAERYQLQVGEGAADEALRVLAGMRATA